MRDASQRTCCSTWKSAADLRDPWPHEARSARARAGKISGSLHAIMQIQAVEIIVLGVYQTREGEPEFVPAVKAVRRLEAKTEGTEALLRLPVLLKEVESRERLARKAPVRNLLFRGKEGFEPAP